jgi:hypothetical protein
MREWDENERMRDLYFDNICRTNKFATTNFVRLLQHQLRTLIEIFLIEWAFVTETFRHWVQQESQTFTVLNHTHVNQNWTSHSLLLMDSLYEEEEEEEEEEADDDEKEIG